MFLLTYLLVILFCCQPQSGRVLKVIQPHSADTVSRYPVTIDVNSRYSTSVINNSTVTALTAASKEVSRKCIV